MILLLTEFALRAGPISTGPPHQAQQERPSRALASEEQGATGLNWGGEDGSRNAGRRGRGAQATNKEAPEWMGAPAPSRQAAPVSRKVIDCSPPNSQPDPSQPAGRMNYKQEEQTYTNKRAGAYDRKSEFSLGGGYIDEGSKNAPSQRERSDYSSQAALRQKARPF